jgi:hypothetical protein
MGLHFVPDIRLIRAFHGSNPRSKTIIRSL